MGPGGHVLTFPVNHGNTLNIVAFHTTTDEWADYPRLTRMGTREEALRDFANYGHDVIELLKLVKPELSVVSLLGNRELVETSQKLIRHLVGDLRPRRPSCPNVRQGPNRYLGGCSPCYLAPSRCWSGLLPRRYSCSSHSLR
jgi:hypothetical protein